MAHDESGEYPHELHGALAKDGWIGIALPEDLGGAGLGISEATMMLHTISEYACLRARSSLSLTIYQGAVLVWPEPSLFMQVSASTQR